MVHFQKQIFNLKLELLSIFQNKTNQRLSTLFLFVLLLALLVKTIPIENIQI